MVRLGILTSIIALLCSIATATAQTTAQAPDTDTATETDSLLHISILTCYPGPEVFQLYGHTAIRVQYAGHDVVYNYGVFDFREPNFIYRFVKGDANYMLAAFPYERFLVDYRYRQSKIVSQTLNIDQNHARYMVALLVQNARPENRYYRYDYIYDNCSTRPRDILEQTLGPSLEYGTPADSTLTFRRIMQSYERNYPWQSFGIGLALGYGIDKPISYRDYFFAPIYFKEALAQATYVDANDERVPVVSYTSVILDGSDEGNVLAKTPIWLSPIAFALLILAISLGVTFYDLKRNRLSRGFDTALYTIYALGGCIIFFLIFFSEHSATSPNLVGLWLNPTYIIPAILLYIKRCKKFLYLYLFINFALLIVVTAGGWCLPQHWNIAFYPLTTALIARQLNYIIYYRKNEN